MKLKILVQGNKLLLTLEVNHGFILAVVWLFSQFAS
ncbi:Uncharacterised protein [Neisseria lactamica]|nr:Uncharacterised protein [Neisseria lactamica]SUA30965.1 Uncharacterised protein [Neisseria lactamica]